MASSSDSLHPRLENDTFSVSVEFMIKVKDAVEQWVTISISWVYTFYTQTAIPLPASNIPSTNILHLILR